MPAASQTASRQPSPSKATASASHGNMDGHWATASIQTSRSASPEPPVITPAETQANQGDDYGIAATLEHSVEDAANPAGTAPSSKTAESIRQPDLESDEEEVPLRPSSVPHPSKDQHGSHGNPSEAKTHKLYKIAVYETQTRYFLVGSDLHESRYRLLKVDRTAPPDKLSVIEDEIVYSKSSVEELIASIRHGNRNHGGFKFKFTCWGLIGFIRFTEGYYMLAVMKKQRVATVGGHYIYQIEDTLSLPVNSTSSYKFPGTKSEESRFISILGNLDLRQSFYFSTTYDVTRTLQQNIISRRRQLANNEVPDEHADVNDMFIWNHHLLKPALEAFKNPYQWCLPIIHGFIDQAAIRSFGRNLFLTIIARRSRFFAGARFLKRGANDLGYVANDVETEQIVADMLVNAFHPNEMQNFNNPNYTSFVQHRGSIPLYWTQDSSGVSPKPAIDLNLTDPFYSTAALHFDNLFERYGPPLYVLNLVKARERNPRETKLLLEYQNAIKYLNQALPEDKKIKYRAYDMSRAVKTRGQDVIGTLEDIAEDIIRTTGFFKNDKRPSDGYASVQNGVVRSNCIDCLDRTNAAQFVIGKRAFAYQLQALGAITEPRLNYDSDTSNLFAHMFNDHGDTLASQYGGSHLVNTTDSYRKINNWQSHSRDMLESFKRFYHNSFLDGQRQEAYNLFLGNYIYAQGQPMLWELPNDYYLHHASPNKRARRRHYIKWFTPCFLERSSLPPMPNVDKELARAVNNEWWEEYYRTPIITSFKRNFVFKMNSTEKYLPKNRPPKYDLSPFSVRNDSPDSNGNQRKRVTISDADSRDIPLPLAATSPPQQTDKRISSLQKWLHPPPTAPKQDPRKSSHASTSAKNTTDRAKSGRSEGQLKRTSLGTADKTHMNQWTLAQFHANSLNPTVSPAEISDYEHYILFSDLMSPSKDHTVKELSASTLINKDDRSTEYEAYLDTPQDVSDKSGGLSSFSTPTNGSQTIEYESWLEIGEDPLSIKSVDWEKKRYQAYDKWLRGKSFFKQNKEDPEIDGGDDRRGSTRHAAMSISSGDQRR